MRIKRHCFQYFCGLICFLLLPVSSGAGQEKGGSVLYLALPAFIQGGAGVEGNPAESDPFDPSAPHSNISQWKGTATCLACHRQAAEEVFYSSHYQWLGETPYMTNGPEQQGKLDMGVNSYCINITGNWNGCGACHVGLGQRPEKVVSDQQLNNIDCLVCHQEGYKRKKVNGTFVPDTSSMTITMVEAARTVHLPTRNTCLPCHAKGGGGDNYKRGDIALAHGATTDRSFDVHMATTGADLSCQECHTTRDHRMAGKGSDLRPTDLDVAMSCTSCHEGKDSKTGHEEDTVNSHVARLACQTCHIPTYARNATDTTASEETETHRDWQKPYPTASGAIHPEATMDGNLVPRYRWWNGKSSSYLLGDPAIVDLATGAIATSRPEGAVDEAASKLYPFKYKTATQPLATNANQLIALDTSVYFATGDADGATRSGLVNMGFSGSESYDWVTTDTYQLITHEVSPKSAALRCGDCHGGGSRMDFDQLGYELKGPESEVCAQCHGLKGDEDGSRFGWIHKEHVDEEKIDCSLCHSFSRPERGLSTNLKYDD